jgi:hypothetical protein
VLHHWWTVKGAQLFTSAGAGTIADFALGFMLKSNGPGIARDLYADVQMLPPGTRTSIAVDPDADHWTGYRVLGVVFNLFSKDSFRLAPGGLANPFTLRCQFAPPFERPLKYEISFGHQGSPAAYVRAEVSPTTIQDAYDALVAAKGAYEAGTAFVKSVMAIPEVS